MGVDSRPPGRGRGRWLPSLQQGPAVSAGPGARRDRRGGERPGPRHARGRSRSSGLQRRPGSRLPPGREGLLPGHAIRGGLPPGGRVPVVLAAGPRRHRAERAGRRILHLRRGRRLSSACGALDLRAGAPEAAALRRRLREGRQDRLGRDHVLRRHAVHDPPGLALRVPPAGLLRSAGKPDQDRVGRGQRLHVQLAFDDRHRDRDGGDRPRLARVGGRGARRQDGGHELPRPDDGFDGQGDGGPRRPGEGRSGRGDEGLLAEGGAARLAPAGRARRQPDL